MELSNYVSSLNVNEKEYYYYDLKKLEKLGMKNIDSLPYSLKVLLETVLRNVDNDVVTEEHVKKLALWGTDEFERINIPFKVSRVILQDLTGTPAIVDLASLRSAMAELGGKVKKINPEIQVDMVIDHSIHMDKTGTEDSLEYNMEMEFKRNKERYAFFKWAQNTFDNLNIIPPGVGIIHQVNLEYLAKVVMTSEKDGKTFAYTDTVQGTDSHTPMINGLGVLGWGVGGIEAEAGMLGEPSYFLIPEVVGVKLKGSLPKTANATDLVLKIVEVLRQKGVVGKFVEFFGEGMEAITLADRATIANMAPEYGATCGFFPIDDKTLDYLRFTGRTEEQVNLVEAYAKENGLFYKSGVEPVYTEVVEIDLSQIEPILAGPRRPQDAILLKDMKKEFNRAVTAQKPRGYELTEAEFDKEVALEYEGGHNEVLKAGSIAIAAITSCTTTSNPYLLIGAALLAKKATEKGLTVPKYVKTSFAPGSRVVSAYLKKADLLKYFDELGFNIAGYGCATCIGNSGNLFPEVEKAIVENDLLTTAVVSANRNFEARVHPLIKGNYLASPLMTVAYALAGTVNIDMASEPLGTDSEGKPVFLDELLPEHEEINEIMNSSVTKELFNEEYSEKLYTSNKFWNEIEAVKAEVYDWDEESTYLQNPPFFKGMKKELAKIEKLEDLRVLCKLGDTITTDHISPAGKFGIDSPAGKFLTEKGLKPEEFNSYGSRRGNHEVMMRGTFANVRLKNECAPGTEGSYTTYFPEDEVMSIYDASIKYQEQEIGLAILGGKDYGMGSSRDWAAKGPYLLGVKTVIAQSYERIHRSNLALMGLLPLQFKSGENADVLGLTGREKLTINIDEAMKPGQTVKVEAKKEDGTVVEFEAEVRFDSNVEIGYYKNGGVLQKVLRNKLLD
jgi:aconitate hydratase